MCVDGFFKKSVFISILRLYILLIKIKLSKDRDAQTMSK